MDGNNNQPQPPQGPQQVNQPQPAQPGFAPGQQPSMQQVTPQGYQMPPKKGLSKGALWGIIGGSIGLVLLIIGVVLAVVFLGGPTRDDYRSAETVAGKMVSSYNKGSALYLSSYATETEAKNDLDTLKKSHTGVSEAYNELKDMKAVKNDPDATEAFKALSAKYDKYVESHNTRVEAYEKIVPILSKINNSQSKSSESAMKTLEEIQDSVKSLDMKTKVNKDYIDDISAKLDKLVVLTKKMVEMQEDYTKYDSKVSSDFYDAISALSDADRDWKSNLDKLVEEGEISKELSEVRSVLFQKSLRG